MLKKVFFVWLLVLSTFIVAQNLSVIPNQTTISDTLNSEIVFRVNVKNISGSNQDVYVVRTINAIPGTWYSALCFDSCFPTELDSIATTSSFNSTSFLPGEEREIALHVFPLVTTGSGNIQIQVGAFSQTERTVIDLVANVSPVSVKDDSPYNFYLSNNYPNPFNPTTIIKYGIKKSTHVKLKVYNLLGVEVAELVNSLHQPGNYEVNFDSGTLSSGIYFYRIATSDFSANGKMILEK
jgi:hypothetical protein